MKITLTKDFKFIHQKGIRECYIEESRGAMMLIAGQYKQVIKPNELKILLADANGQEIQEEAPKKEAISEDIMEDSIVQWASQKTGKNVTGVVQEIIENGKRARVKADSNEKIIKVDMKSLSLIS